MDSSEIKEFNIMLSWGEKMENYDRRWMIIEDELKLDRMNYYESLFTLGNGYLGSRGAFEEDYLRRETGTFVAGLFDKFPNQVTELPNLPDWLAIEIELAGERFKMTEGQILDYKRVLDLRKGILYRKIKWQSPTGLITSLAFRRFVSVSNKHLMGINLQITPENYSGEIIIKSRLNGQVTNDGTQHFVEIEGCTFDKGGIYLSLETIQSKKSVTIASQHQLVGEIEEEKYKNGPRIMEYQVSLAGEKGKEIQLNKLVTLYTSRDIVWGDITPTVDDVQDKTLESCQLAVERGFEAELADHIQVWASHWEQSDLTIEGNDFDQLALRFSIYHLIQMTPFDDSRVSVAAKGLSGKGYKGHVFWDTEIFVLPFFIYNYPAVARNLLLYRYHTLPGALQKARENGYQGAMYAWESAETGQETTPKYGGLDLETRKPIRIWCGEIEQHISLDIAYAIWHYYRASGDNQFIIDYGAEILFQIARFWKSRVTYDSNEDCFEIYNVIGPDEYSEFVDNNYYTNQLVQWQLKRAIQVCDLLKEWGQYQELAERIDLTDEELREWKIVANKIKLNQRQDGLLVQYDGFLDLKEIGVLSYRQQPGTLLDYLSWEEINQSQVLKQADVMMLLYLLDNHYSKDIKQINWDFYEPKTMHDSSLSAAIHAIVASRLDMREEAYSYFGQASRIDLVDEMGNSDKGLHAASMGGLWQAVVNGFAGLKISEEGLTIEPVLPEKWERITFKYTYKGTTYQISASDEEVQVSYSSGDLNPVRFTIWGQKFRLEDKAGLIITRKYNK